MEAADEIIRDLRQRIDELERLLARSALRTRPPPSLWLNIVEAEALTKRRVSRTKLYRLARDGAGEKTPTGEWRFHKYKLIEAIFTQSERAALGAGIGAIGVEADIPKSERVA
jgi:hypothetical protein